jgi:hypothetical protein
VLSSFAVGIAGSQSLTAPINAGRTFSVRLVVTLGGRETFQSVPVGVTCPSVWFFGDQFAPPGSGCPAPAITSSGAFQGFERGFMIYISAAGINRIYGMQQAESRYIAVVNGWDGVTLNTTPAPPGLFIPQQMFNWVYYSTLAPIGTWNSALGWATGDIALGQFTIQFEGSQSPTSPFYIDSPVGAVFRFSGGDVGVWSRVR